jgi:hypothetical protein
MSAFLLLQLIMTYCVGYKCLIVASSDSDPKYFDVRRKKTLFLTHPNVLIFSKYSVMLEPCGCSCFKVQSKWSLCLARIYSSLVIQHQSLRRCKKYWESRSLFTVIFELWNRITRNYFPMNSEVVTFTEISQYILVSWIPIFDQKILQDKQWYRHKYHNFGHYPLSCFLFRNTAFHRLDSFSVFRWNLLRWAQ